LIKEFLKEFKNKTEKQIVKYLFLVGKTKSDVQSRI